MKKRLIALAATAFAAAIMWSAAGAPTAQSLGNDWERAPHHRMALGNDWEAKPTTLALGNDWEFAPRSALGNDWE